MIRYKRGCDDSGPCILHFVKIKNIHRGHFCFNWHFKLSLHKICGPIILVLCNSQHSEAEQV